MPTYENEVPVFYQLLLKLSKAASKAGRASSLFCSVYYTDVVQAFPPGNENRKFTNPSMRALLNCRFLGRDPVHIIPKSSPSTEFYLIRAE